MKLGVVITTYNSPKWLEKVFWGYEAQSDSDFELIIADDGSTDETKNLIAKYQEHSTLNIKHVWHEDNGFQKTIILNKAIASTDCDYLIFTDGDCIPRYDLVSVHKEQAEVGHYCSAGYYKLTMPVSEMLSKDDIVSRNAFDYEWLKQQGQTKNSKSLKLTCKKDWLFNLLTPAKATWNGANSSAYKKDIVSVNGFDERMQYGGLDVEMGERMLNKGIKSKQIRYSTVCIHLDHARGYSSPESWEKNKSIREKVKFEKLAWTDYGLQSSSSVSAGQKAR
jgi:glycosyltransferase involved in cell wall biosynthesis